MRLKGGDPFIFARGVEEMFLAKDAGFDVEVIPGLTSGIAVPAINGIALTLREKSDAVLLVTGHQISEDKVKEWAKFIKTGATLVVYMGLNNIEEIKKYLLLAELEENLSVIAIQDGSLDSEIILKSELSSIANDIKDKNLHSPTLLVFGKYIIETLA